MAVVATTHNMEPTLHMGTVTLREDTHQPDALLPDILNTVDINHTRVDILHLLFQFHQTFITWHGGHDGLGFLGGGVTVGAGVYGARPGSHGYGSHGYGSPGQESHGYGGYGQHHGNYGQHGDKLGYHKMWK
ncbi:hypothetical protein Tco_0405279 [Tanacetum coccineum]